MFERSYVVKHVESIRPPSPRAFSSPPTKRKARYNGLLGIDSPPSRKRRGYAKAKAGTQLSDHTTKMES